MKLKVFFLVFLISTSAIALGQTENFKIQDIKFAIKTKTVTNEWKTQDILKEVYAIENVNEKLVLSYFAYKDEGGDCNNLFWDKEWMNIKGKKIIVTTHHFQKMSDPITEWERKTFTINKNREVELTQHLFKKYGSTEWKESEEWYKK